MGSGREGLPSSPVGDGRVEKPRRKSGGGIDKEKLPDLHENNGCKINNGPIGLDLGNAGTLSVSATDLPPNRLLSPRVEKPRRKSGGGIDKEKLPDLHENNGCEINNGPIGLDLRNAGNLSVSATDPPSNRLLNPKNRVAHFSRVNSLDSKEQNQQQQARRNPKRSSSMPKLEDKQVDEGSVVGRRKRRPNMTEGRERNPLNGNLSEERIKEELKSPSEISKTKSPRINSKTEVAEEIGLQQANGSPPSRSGRSTKRFMMEALVTEGGNLRLVDIGTNIRNKRKVPEPNVPIPELDLRPTHSHSISPISQLDPEPNYSHVIVPNPHLSPEVVYPDPNDSHLVPPIPFTGLEPIDPQPNSPSTHMFPDPVDPQPNPPGTLDFPEPVDDHPNPAIAHLVSPNSIDPHPIIYKETSVEAPVPTKNSPYLTRRSRRTYREYSEGPDRIQDMVDLIMWKDTPKSALMFGFGSFCVLSSSFTQELHFSLVTFSSYLALVYLAAVFFYKNILQRGVVEQDCSPVNYEAISEAYALSILRLVLPFVNGLLAKFRELFSGDPATTMKLASIIWLLAQCGHKMTIWTLAKLSFFAIFTIPKLYSCYSAQLHRYGHFMLCRFWDAWNTCSHKKGVLVAVFLLLWNLSTVTARVWGAFILIVAFRLYQQSLTTDLDNQNADPSQEDIQIPQTQLMRIPQPVF